MNAPELPERATAQNQRPLTTPDFALSHASGSLRSQGAARTTSSIDQAARWLRSGEVEMLVGAIPFDPHAPAALTVPASFIHSTGPLEPPAHYRFARPRAEIVASYPSRADHAERVVRAIAAIHEGPIDQVVIARALWRRWDEPLDPPAMVALLIDGSPNGDGYLVDLSPAGQEYTNHFLVGSSPEILIRKCGDQVSAFPLAGSARRRLKDPAADRSASLALSSSEKDLAEHAFVVSYLEEILGPLCSELHVPRAPELTPTTQMWHLGSSITGTLHDSGITALDLARAVHPTPAVCGTPTDAAARYIASVEGDRRFYAGATGWCDSKGNGTYVVAIRCAEIHADRHTLTTWAGGGVVANSVSTDELAETDAKLRTILSALSIDTA